MYNEKDAHIRRMSGVLKKYNRCPSWLAAQMREHRSVSIIQVIRWTSAVQWLAAEFLFVTRWRGSACSLRMPDDRLSTKRDALIHLRDAEYFAAQTGNVINVLSCHCPLFNADVAQRIFTGNER